MKKANSRANLSLSQGGLATPPLTFIDLPDTLATSGSPAVGEANIILHACGSTMQESSDSSTRGPSLQESCENATPQTLSQALIQATTPASAKNTTPTSQANNRKKQKFYVVTRGRRTGVFDNW